MKCSCAFMLLLWMTACDLPNGTNTQKVQAQEQKIVSSKQAMVKRLPDDPSFVESGDTISIDGPRSITRNMLQDKKGNYWFATWQGIIRYNGKEFTNMSLKEGLGHFRFFSVFEDRAGNLWFGSVGGGMYRYNGSYFNYFTTADGLAGNVVMCMLEDNTGNMWFGTNGGVSCYNGNTFANFTRKDGLANDSVYAIVQDNNGMLWFGTQGAVCCYYPSAGVNGKSLTKIMTKEAPFGNVRAMIKDKAGNIWFGTTSGGLSCYDGKSFTYFGSKEGLERNYVGCILEDKAGDIWIGGDVYRYNGKTFSRFQVKEGQSSNSVFCIYQDQSGDLWFCSMDGVRRYSKGNGAGNTIDLASATFTDFTGSISR